MIGIDELAKRLPPGLRKVALLAVAFFGQVGFGVGCIMSTLFGIGVVSELSRGDRVRSEELFGISAAFGIGLATTVLSYLVLRRIEASTRPAVEVPGPVAIAPWLDPMWDDSLDGFSSFVR